MKASRSCPPKETSKRILKNSMLKSSTAQALSTKSVQTIAKSANSNNATSSSPSSPQPTFLTPTISTFELHSTRKERKTHAHSRKPKQISSPLPKQLKRKVPTNNPKTSRSSLNAVSSSLVAASAEAPAAILTPRQMTTETQKEIRTRQTMHQKQNQDQPTNPVEISKREDAALEPTAFTSTRSKINPRSHSPAGSATKQVT